jgi:hypothetical protein
LEIEVLGLALFVHQQNEPPRRFATAHCTSARTDWDSMALGDITDRK